VSRRLLSSELVMRFVLVAAGVGVCYLFDWRWLRSLTCDLNLRLDGLAGVHLQRVAYDAVMYRGALYSYGIACTFADVWCGGIPLLWDLRRSVGRNLATVLAFGGALLVFNVARLSFSDVLFAKGLSWDLAHNVVSGICYFAIWTWIWKNRSWQ
jgi:hypothetical protein